MKHPRDDNSGYFNIKTKEEFSDVWMELHPDTEADVRKEVEDHVKAKDLALQKLKIAKKEGIKASAFLTPEEREIAAGGVLESKQEDLTSNLSDEDKELLAALKYAKANGLSGEDIVDVVNQENNENEPETVVGDDNESKAEGEPEKSEEAPDAESVGDKIKLALDLLDHDNDEHWTQAGLPSMDAVEALVGDDTITRSDVESASPGFVRNPEAI